MRVLVLGLFGGCEYSSAGWAETKALEMMSQLRSWINCVALA